MKVKEKKEKKKEEEKLNRCDCACIRSRWTNLVNVPVTELSWNLNLVGIFIHSQVNVTAEPFKLHNVPLLVVQQTSQSNEELASRGRANTWNQMDRERF